MPLGQRDVIDRAGFYQGHALCSPVPFAFAAYPGILICRPAPSGGGKCACPWAKALEDRKKALEDRKKKILEDREAAKKAKEDKKQETKQE